MIFLILIDDSAGRQKFERLYHVYKQYIFQICNGILHNEHSAEDAAQETLICIARNINKIKDIDSKETRNFIHIISQHRAIDIYRKNKRDFTFNLDTLADSLNDNNPIDLNLIRDERIREIADVIASLPKIYAEALELYLFYELSRHEIAGILGISYTAAKLRILKGKRMLSDELRARGIV